MKKLTLALFTVIATGLMSAPSTSEAAMGGGNMFMVGLSFMRIDTQYSGPSFGEQGNATSVYDVKAGYMMSNGLYLGAIYDMRTDEATVGQTTTKTDRSGYGPTVGYHNMGWFIDGSYYFSSMIKPSSGSDYTGGSGFGIDLGKNWDLAANLYLGLQLSYKSFTYTKHGSVDETNKIKSELMPMLNLGVQF